ncbi:uncharacterized protein M421DRAFT_420811 [Didymella exigua CBS 183.55]|uniref:Uncharacterized protein n=1 Tax=Didymella exigua CBS 183.55 TaxID=1150837 RepID=A0A6A5RMN3_9PLEO|nr:uncharacterized protein M421DRAFT_420811 [Didymella exigua CBS 183.55]KAF1928264.1 hypothetical protein M421DRAFT_420811 [Didymella exigua CBS 183.55]
MLILSSLLAAAYSLATTANAIAINVDDIQNTLGQTIQPNTQNPCALAESASVNASVQLSSWLECQINGFYPYPENGNWPIIRDAALAKDIKFTFNDTHYNYEGSLDLYHSFNATLGESFAPFQHGFINTLGIPNANGDKGGFVYMIGWAGGMHRLAKRTIYFTNAAFAVIRDNEGKRQIVEFRESSNIPNTAKLPTQNEWTCGFKEHMEL